MSLTGDLLGPIWAGSSGRYGRRPPYAFWPLPQVLGNGSNGMAILLGIILSPILIPLALLSIAFWITVTAICLPITLSLDIGSTLFGGLSYLFRPTAAPVYSTQQTYMPFVTNHYGYPAAYSYSTNLAPVYSSQAAPVQSSVSSHPTSTPVGSTYSAVHSNHPQHTSYVGSSSSFFSPPAPHHPTTTPVQSTYHPSAPPM